MTITYVGLIATDGSATAREAAQHMKLLGRNNIAIAYLNSGIRCVRENHDIPTACLDNKQTIHINPGFWATGCDQRALLVHELLHLGLDHHSRIGQRDLKLFNIASDAVINTIISQGLQMGVVAPGAITLPDEYKGALVSEDIYEFLKQNPSSLPQNANGEAGKGCGVAESDGIATDAEGALPDPNAISKVTLGELARGVGGAFAKAFERLDRPPRVVPAWKKIMRKAISALVANTNGSTHPTYSRATKRNGVILPKYRGSIPTVAVVIDTSGSMTPEARSEIVKQTVILANEFPSVSIFVVAHTSEVVYQGWAKAGSIRAMAEAGCSFSGGTYFKPAYDKVESECGKQVDLLCHFTDGEGESVWPKVPAKQFVWCDYGRGYGTKPPENTIKVKM